MSWYNPASWDYGAALQKIGLNGPSSGDLQKQKNLNQVGAGAEGFAGQAQHDPARGHRPRRLRRCQQGLKLAVRQARHHGRDHDPHRHTRR